jgi:hypothetical protein
MVEKLLTRSKEWGKSESSKAMKRNERKKSDVRKSQSFKVNVS